MQPARNISKNFLPNFNNIKEYIKMDLYLIHLYSKPLKLLRMTSCKGFYYDTTMYSEYFQQPKRNRLQEKFWVDAFLRKYTYL